MMTGIRPRAAVADIPSRRVWLRRGRLGLIGAILLMPLCLVGWSVLKRFDPDEIEAVHSAWKILKGERIYVDFFQHHHPLLYAYLAPIIAICGERPATIVACRLAMLPFFAGIAGGAFVLGRRVFGGPAAKIGLFLLLCSWPLIFKAVEIRPDVPQVMFGMIALALLFGRGGASARATVIRYSLVGLCLGVSFLFLQKAVFAIAGVLAVTAWRIRCKEVGWVALVALMGGMAGALISFGIWVVGCQMVAEYLFLNWTLNAHFRARYAFAPFAGVMFITQPLTVAFALAAVIWCLRDRRQRELVCVAAILGGAVVAARRAWPQYWLPVLPLVAMFAGHGLAALLKRRRVLLAVLLVCSALTPPIVEAIRALGFNRHQMEKIGYVLSITGPGDRVYDPSLQFNLFRDDVDYFWFSTGERQVLGAYRALRPYPYDVCERIDRFKPKVISSSQIRDIADPRIQEHYRKSARYQDLYIRMDP